MQPTAVANACILASIAMGGELTSLISQSMPKALYNQKLQMEVIRHN
jgi:hypothetical protein